MLIFTQTLLFHKIKLIMTKAFSAQFGKNQTTLGPWLNNHIPASLKSSITFTYHTSGSVKTQQTSYIT